MKNIDSKSHVRGESVYLDDIPVIQGTLFACVFDSPVAHGKLKSIDTTEAAKSEGVFRVITAKDLIGEKFIAFEPDVPTRKVIDRHAPPLAVVHHVKPPRMFASRTHATSFLFADLANSHPLFSFLYWTVVGAPL